MYVFSFLLSPFPPSVIVPVTISEKASKVDYLFCSGVFCSLK